MKPLLVHVHIFDSALWPELRDCVQNMVPCPMEVFITMVEQQADTQADIRQTFPDAHIDIVVNRGYDVGPFVHILNQVDLNSYSYVVKLHTKRDMPSGSSINGFDVSGARWRQYALAPFRKDNFGHTLKAFSQQPRLGMVADYHLIAEKERDDTRAQQEAFNLLESLKLNTQRFSFVAGTMFIVRAELLKPLQRLNWQLSNFEAPDACHSHSLAHVAERLFGCLVTAQGYTLCDTFTANQYKGEFFYMLRRLRRFLYRCKITASGKKTIKVCNIPVYRKRLI